MSAKAVQSDALKRLSVDEGLAMVAGPPDELDRYFLGEEEPLPPGDPDAGIKIE